LLFPKHDYAKDIVDLRREYEQKMRSAWKTSALDDSVWVRKFAELDSDYERLVKDVQSLRDENAMLREQLHKLLLLI
jgi:predicted nuclease with TOPRIM domain